MAEQKPFEMIFEINPNCAINESGEACMQVIRKTDLVRCRDCIHRPITIGSGDKYECATLAPDDETDYKCPCLNEDDPWYSWMPKDDFFCAYGERSKANE